MILEGDTSVIAALKEKKHLMDAGKPHDHLKILMICDGGLIKGAYSVGVGLALEELGYTKVFSDVVGVSSGAPSVAYFLGGNVHEGGSLIYQECCSKKFFNKWNLWNLTNTKFISDVLKGETGKGLQTDKIFNSPTKLHIAVTNFQTAESLLIRPDNPENLLESIEGSILMPHMSSATVSIDGVRVMDGGFSCPHVIDKATTAIDCTHVLLLTSQNHKDETIGWFELFMCHTFFRFRFSARGLIATRNRRHSRREALRILLRRTDVKTLMVWGDSSISGTERDGAKVKEVVERSRKWWLEVMA